MIGQWVQIGCQIHTLEDWESFDDETISFMDYYALDFWQENKEFISKLVNIQSDEKQLTGDM